MSRNIELTRIHALNWFGYHDVLDVHGNLLIAGVTGSGKSILMDLAQLVLVGDQKSKYNQSATGKASTRTLKSYCLGDTKQEIEGVAQYMRPKGAITYAALEFTWPDGERRETWGLRIEFESAAQNQAARKHGFLISGRMNRADWLDDGQFPLEWAAFRDKVEEKGGKVFETMEAYRREMAQPSHLNFDRSTLDYLLPTAMSFTFLDSFNRFCRNFVLPPTEVEITEVRDSYHAFQGLRRELGVLNKQLQYLERISALNEERGLALLDRDLYGSIARELAVEDQREQVEEYDESIARIEAQLKAEGSKQVDLEDQLNRGRERRDVLRDALNTTGDGQLFLHLREENRKLVGAISRLKEAGDEVDEGRKLRARQIRQWLGLARQLPTKLASGALDKLEEQLGIMESCEFAQLGRETEAVATAAYTARAAVNESCAGVAQQARQLVEKLGKTRAKVDRIEDGRLATQTALLDALNSALPRGRDGEPAARALRELCEVADEQWRPAIEIAFTRKFGVVVAPEHYDLAERIYGELKQDTRGESLVNPMQALELRGLVQPGALAEKILTEHPVARKIVDHLFGRLICVEERGELRKYEAAIMPDGFTYRRPFAERRAHYDQRPVVGAKGMAQQRAHLTEEMKEVRAQLRSIEPVIQKLEEAEAFFVKSRLDQAAVHPALSEALQLASYEKSLAENIERLRSIETGDYESKEIELRNLESELAGIEKEIKALKQSELTIELGKLQGQRAQTAEALEEAEEALRVHREEELTLAEHAERRGELMEKLLADYPVLDAAVDQAQRMEQRHLIAGRELREQLVAARRELAHEFPQYHEFSPESDDNRPWQERLERISDSEIPSYQQKAKREEENWQELFRTQVLVKLRSALMQVDHTLNLLNRELRRPIGNHTYQIRRKANPDYKLYRQLIDNAELVEEGGLFFEAADLTAREEVEKLFQKLVDDPKSLEALAFLDYRNYYDYDMMVGDVRDPNGRETSVDKQSGKFSGGESQSPYFIAILACYLRAYHRYQGRNEGPSIGLVPIDEAFSKLSGERIRDCITALKDLDLQGLFSMSSGNIPYAMDLCDQMLTIAKKEFREGKLTHVRNIPVSLTQKQALERMG